MIVNDDADLTVTFKIGLVDGNNDDRIRIEVVCSIIILDTSDSASATQQIMA